MQIKQWPKSERPREKLLQSGPDRLSDAELLAIFIRSGSAGRNAVDLAREVLAGFESLRHLIDASLESFTATRGLGPSQYVQIQAAIELGKRYLECRLQTRDILNNPEDTRQYLSLQLGAYDHEVFACLFLDNQHQVIAFRTLFRGTIDTASVHPREVVKEALKLGAAAIIIAHNHPSGHLQASQSDRIITQRLKDALALVDIRLLDHILVAHNATLSFAEQGLL